MYAESLQYFKIALDEIAKYNFIAYLTSDIAKVSQIQFCPKAGSKPKRESKRKWI
jgi:hypothetical protein